MSGHHFKHVVSGLFDPKRADAYLAGVLKEEFSREEIKNAIVSGQIKVNDQIIRASSLVRNDDKVEGIIVSQRLTQIKPKKLAFGILFEDKHLIVVDKPTGLTVHPGAGNRDNTLVNALLHHSPNLSDASGSDRPGIVHRIDKDTSGILLVAKTNKAHRALQDQFAQREISKIYIALVSGHVSHEQGHIDKPIGRDPKIRNKMAVRLDDKSREAYTSYKTLKRFRAATLLEVKILTGRTHQIRVHLTHIGHPVIGDELYYKKINHERLMLHASKISFCHPENGKLMTFESPLPNDFKEVLDRYEHEPNKR